VSRIAPLFEQLRAQGRTALVPYITAGDPAPEHTLGLMNALVEGGADIIELGVPFSDPMADGTVIQAAHERALKHGLGLRGVLDIVRSFREHNQTTPVVLMGYQNPVEAMGVAEFTRLAHESGIDGVLTVDMPPEEAGEVADALRGVEIDPIFLVAPTTGGDRIDTIARLASGFVYYVSLKGVTGADSLDVDAIEARLADIRRHTGELPLGVGFGIRDAETAARVGKVADAVVIGSALVRLIDETARSSQADGAGMARVASEFMADIRKALDSK